MLFASKNLLASVILNLLFHHAKEQYELVLQEWYQILFLVRPTKVRMLAGVQSLPSLTFVTKEKGNIEKINKNAQLYIIFSFLLLIQL